MFLRVHSGIFVSLGLLLLLTFFPVPAMLAQDRPDELQMDDTLALLKPVDLFEGEEPLKLIMRFDLKHYQRTKHKAEYQEVDLELQVNDSLHIKQVARIKARGSFRRDHCSMAPFWLNFRKAGVGNIYLQSTKKMKVVTHCNQKGAASYLIKEYLIYKMYELLTPYSFRTRLIRMTYIDTGRKNRETCTWAFLIEPVDMVAERTGALVIKKDRLSMTHMRNKEMLLLAQFHYMIGNGDYSIVGRKNLKLLGRDDFGAAGYTPLPYDFDYTGFVDAIYAIPGEKLGTESITERYYLGPCREEEEYMEVMDELEAYREDFLEVVLSCPYLVEKESERAVSYLEEYFSMAEKDSFIERELKSTCR